MPKDTTTIDERVKVSANVFIAAIGLAVGGAAVWFDLRQEVSANAKGQEELRIEFNNGMSNLVDRLSSIERQKETWGRPDMADWTIDLLDRNPNLKVPSVRYTSNP